jgi:NAD-dependent SIR2 family protein deacetylase
MRGTRWTLWSLIVGLQLVTAALAGTGCSDAANTSHEPGVVRQAECLSCHESDLKAVLSPPHDTLPTTCQDCHTESQWIPAASTAIHTPLPASCVTCHENDPQPETIFHTQVFEPECASCHRNYPGWAPADFLHAPVPGSCNECHSDLRPTTPSHQSAAGLGDCARCHIVDDWAVTDVAALHAPLPASCKTCHQSEPRQSTIFHTQVVEPECASCHRSYPDWTQVDFLHEPVPGTCNACHSNLRPATPTHQSAAGLGDCAGCHVVNDWKLADPKTLHTPLPAACIGCHGNEPRSSNPFHAQTYDPECATCHHSYPDWTPATFAHLPKPTRCYDCHESQRPTTSTHPAAGDCLGCHATSAWLPATGGTHPESAFPIQSGAHSRYRNDCAACHNASLGSPVMGDNADCVGCHDGEHARAEMDARHREQRDYPTGSAPPNFCLDCHADGRN